MDSNTKCSSGVWKDFIESRLWAEFRNELEKWIRDIEYECSNPNGSYEDRFLSRLGGSADAVRRVLALPEVIFETKRDEENTEDSNE